ncbi:MAG TPA: ABC transporter transmembrane domain-containing protein, partial [Chthoniobacterales bacterium]|nr:ABC transporter transmembrane domain-containing protein [Chthoniobacterales bacterium]
MSEPQAAPKKPSFWQTLRTGWGPYKRLYSYVKPYRWRFIAGLALGFGFGVVSNGLMPLVIGKVTGAVFQGSAPPTPGQFVSNPSMQNQLNQGPKINGILLTCLLIPLVMGARSVCAYGNAVLMNWVSNRVVTDVRNELFNKMVRHSMDFFNKMRSGFLMSRITNDTRGMQMALSTISSDLFKQPVAIISGVVVLLILDWRFTLVTLVLFPVCLVPIILYGRKARKSVQHQYEDLGQMVMTMQETFAGIRVIKSFAREKHQQDSFVRSNQMLFDNIMRVIRAMEAT